MRRKSSDERGRPSGGVIVLAGLASVAVAVAGRTKTFTATFFVAAPLGSGTLPQSVNPSQSCTSCQDNRQISGSFSLGFWPLLSRTHSSLDRFFKSPLFAFSIPRYAYQQAPHDAVGFHYSRPCAATSPGFLHCTLRLLNLRQPPSLSFI